MGSACDTEPFCGECLFSEPRALRGYGECLFWSRVAGSPGGWNVNIVLSQSETTRCWISDKQCYREKGVLSPSGFDMLRGIRFAHGFGLCAVAAIAYFWSREHFVVEDSVGSRYCKHLADAFRVTQTICRWGQRWLSVPLQTRCWGKTTVDAHRLTIVVEKFQQTPNFLLTLLFHVAKF